MVHAPVAVEFGPQKRFLWKPSLQSHDIGVELSAFGSFDDSINFFHR